MKKKILVTGAAGFIGYHLASALHKRGDFVIGLDNFNDYYSPQLKEDRTEELQKLGVEVVIGDLSDSERLNEVVEENAITHIAHLAAQAGVRYSLTNPQAYVKSNLEGFVNILELCRHHPNIKLTYASSSSVYGLSQPCPLGQGNDLSGRGLDPSHPNFEKTPSLREGSPNASPRREDEKIPFSEKDRTDHPVSLYGATKKANELFAQTYHHLYGIAVTGLRFFTVYGPWGRPDMAYFSFSKNILEGKPIEIYNYGKMQRDFTYIDDIIAGTIAAIDLESECEIFNLGNHKPVELIRFIEILEEALGKKAKVEMLSMQKGDVFKTFADIEHSQKMLGFNPKISLHEGLTKFVAWFKHYYAQ